MTLRRTLLALAVVIGAVLVPRPAHAEPVVKQPFLVTADGCRLSYTEGVLGWEFGITVRQVAHVSGVVVDEVNSPCLPIIRAHTEATFSALMGSRVVDVEKFRVDDAVLRIAFDLEGATILDAVRIEVCRVSLVGPRPECAAKDFPRPRPPAP